MTDAEAHARRYAWYAAAALALTVVAGTWLRVAMLHPPALGGFAFRHAVHAHSHVALFGWTTMALLAVIVRAAGIARPWARRHAQLVALGSAAAFVGFLQMGYAAPTIAVATAHVALWWAFAALAWRPLAVAPPVARRFLRAALMLLVVSGLGTVAPGIAMATGVADPWIRALAVELFLSPFLVGWLGLGAAGALYATIDRPRHHRLVLPLLALGAVPVALLRAGAPAPAEWLTLVGRAGTLAAGAGTLLLALDVLRAPRRPPLVRLAGAAFLIAGITDVGVALAADGALLANQQLRVAYLHLVLLGAVTPALLATAVAPRLRVPALAAAHGVGLAVTLAALVALGTPWLGALAAGAGAGAGARGLLVAALAGGALSAVAVLGVLAVAWRARRHALRSATAFDAELDAVGGRSLSA